MKKLIADFADALLSREQLKVVKGGARYCTCGPNNEWLFNPNPHMDCATFCSLPGMCKSCL